MSKHTLLTLGLLAILLSGCVTAGRPKSATPAETDAALLRGHVDMLRYYTHGEPRVDIVAIDNVRTAPFVREIPVAAGQRLVTVSVIALPPRSATATIALDFQTRTRYQLTAQLAEKGFDVMFWDESQGTEPRILLKTSRIGGKYANIAAPNSATLRGSKANSLGYGPWGEPFVRITAVDGMKINPGFGRTPDTHVAAGRRLVTMDVRTRSGWHASGTVELEVQSGKTYILSASKVNHDFELFYWIEFPGTDPRSLVAKTRLRGSFDFPGGGALLFLPLIR